MLNYVEYGKENKYDDDIFFQKYSQMSLTAGTSRCRRMGNIEKAAAGF